MQFPDNYFDDEVRDGFLVSGIIKKSWAAQLEVLSDIDTLCRKHGIRWFADCGTLLGAVRHGGFVPWDDDLDICMLRDDYNKFIKIAPSELPEWYSVINIHSSEEFTEMNTRVTNTMGIDYRREHTERYHEFPYPAGIDIFVLDYIARDSAMEDVRKNLVKVVITLLDGINEEGQDSPEIQASMTNVEQLCGVKFDRSRAVAPQVRVLADRIFSLYTAEEADEVALMVYWVSDDDHKYKLEYFKEMIELPFENIRIQAPAMYDAVLKVEYGDYMKLARKGGLHDYPYFIKYEKMAEEALGGKLPYRYYFSKDDMLPAVKDSKNIRKDTANQIENIVNKMREIHILIDKLISVGSFDVVLTLLEQCQNAAINVGNLAEQVYGEGFAAVPELEKYCESIYNAYQYITSEEESSTDELKTALDMAIDEAAGIVKRYIENRREVVFIPYKASMWDCFDGLWRECMEDEKCDVYVTPIPYYYKNERQEIIKECYEGNEFPSDVPVTDYSTYNFENRHPDEIYIQYPYDSHNFVINIHPYFYSENMRKYTDRLTFVQPFVVDEIDAYDEKGLKNLREYICNTAIINADKVITQSEQMRQHYIEILTEFAGEDTRKVWEDKVDGSGYPRAEESADAKKHRIISHFPDSWKLMLSDNNGQEKKIILYNNSISAILQNREQFIGKLRSVLQIFEENSSNILLLWRHNSLIRPTLEKTYPDMWAEYNKVIEQYKKEGWGIYDDVTSAMDAAAISDAYYGDVDSIVQKFRRMDKPVMIEDMEVV